MKLSQINEMFENVSLPDDVDIRISSNAIVYWTTIDSESFNVDYYKSGTNSLPGSFLRQHSDNSEMLSHAVDTIGGIWGIGLQGPNSYSSTGMGNFAEVYGFLLASLQDMITNRGVNALTFKGAEPGMDTVYNRFIKSFQRSGNPAFHFYSLAGDVWISERGIQLLDNIMGPIIRQQIADNIGDHDSKIKVDRMAKMNMKRYKHLLFTSVMFNGRKWRISSISRTVPGVYGHSPTENGGSDGQHFTPEMIEQFESAI